MKDISLSRAGQVLIVTIALFAAGCAGLRITPPEDLTPIPDTTGSHFLVFGEGALWSVQYESHPGFRLEDYYFNYDYYVLQIDPETSKVAARVHIPEVPGYPKSLVAGEGAVWVAFEGSQPIIYKIDPMTSRIVATIPVGPRGGYFRGGTPVRLAAGEGAVWAVRPGEKVLFRVDPRSNEVTSIPLKHRVSDVSVGAGSVWVLHIRNDAISRIDPRTHRLVATIRTPQSRKIGSLLRAGRTMTMGAGAMWVVLRWPNMVGRLNPQSNQFVATIDLSPWLTDIDARGPAIWASAVHAEGGLFFSPCTVYYSIVEIDSTTNTVKQKVPLGSVSDIIAWTSEFLAVGPDAVWVYLPGSGIYCLPFGDGSSQRK